MLIFDYWGVVKFGYLSFCQAPAPEWLNLHYFHFLQPLTQLSQKSLFLNFKGQNSNPKVVISAGIKLLKTILDVNVLVQVALVLSLMEVEFGWWWCWLLCDDQFSCQT